MSPIHAVELLFFAIFGQTTHEHFKVVGKLQPDYTTVFFKLAFGIYMLVSVVVLINLLIAMMSDTYQRIQAQSDIEWKYGLSKLIRNMHRKLIDWTELSRFKSRFRSRNYTVPVKSIRRVWRLTSTAPSPLNLLTTWISYLYRICKKRVAKRKRPSVVHMMGFQRPSRMSARSKMGAKWLSKIKKGQVAHKDSIALSVVHLSPLGSQLSFSNATRIDTVVDWDVVRKKYRELVGEIIEPEKPFEERKENVETDPLSAMTTSTTSNTNRTLEPDQAPRL